MTAALALVAAVMAGCGSSGGGGGTTAPAPAAPATLSSIAAAASAGFTSPAGMAVSRDGHRLYFTARRAPDDAPAVYVLDLATRAVTQLFGGAPLVEPGALAVTNDNRTLLIADMAADGGGELSGVIYQMPADGGGSPQPLLPVDTLDLPVGLTLDRAGTHLYVSAYTPDGEPALWTMSTLGAKPTVVLKGAPLFDPSALAVTSDQQSLLVVDDGAAADGGSALLRVPLSGSGVETVTSGIPLAWPAGLAVDNFGGHALITGQSPGTGLPGVISVALADHAVTTLFSGGPTMQPTALVPSPLTASVLYVADADASGGILTIFH